MQGETFNARPDNPPPTGVPWYKTLTRYHWFVLGVAALGWLFDCLDQQLFVLARPAAMKELVQPLDKNETPIVTAQRRQAGGDIATSIFIAGWACGGLFFGMLGDRIGRAKTMLITILLYSGFTGLSAMATGLWDFALYRFLTGLGVGGEFAVGVALVAEVMPTHARTYALSLLQALSAVGNISAAFINLGLGVAEAGGAFEGENAWLETSPWRLMFIIGAAPALLALIIRYKLKEPEKWQQARHDDVLNKQLGSYRELFGTPLWRKHALLGLVLGCAGVIGLWSVGFYTPDLIRFVQEKALSAEVFQEKADEALAAGNDAEHKQWTELLAVWNKEGRTEAIPAELRPLQDSVAPIVSGRATRWQSYTSLMINLGAFFGMFGFGLLAQRIGRKPTFAIAFVAAFISTVSVFWFLNSFWQIFVMVPIMGFCQLSLFGGYAIYFPELFPTRLRSTGTSFCYNVGRFVAAFGPIVKTWLNSIFSETASSPVEALRYTGVTMCLVFLIGLLVLPFLPETRGKELPE